AHCPAASAAAADAATARRFPAGAGILPPIRAPWAWSARRERQLPLATTSFSLLESQMHSIPEYTRGSRVQHKKFRARRHSDLRGGYTVQVSAKIVIDLVLAIECPDAKSRLRGAECEDVLSCNGKSSDRTG